MGSIHLEVLIGAALGAGAYVHAWRTRGEPMSGGRGAAFFAALGALVIALNGPLHDLSEQYLFSAHMVQHLLLTLIVPPLLLAGMPGWMIDALLAPFVTRRGVGAAIRALTRPVPALGLHAVALFFWHLPGPYGAALTSHTVHIAEHFLLGFTALLAWWPVLSSSARVPALPYGAQILYLFAFGFPMTIVAAMVTGAEKVLYPFYAAAPRIMDLTPLEDQRLGGVIMWVPAGLIPLIAFTAVFFRWAASEPEETTE